MERFRALYTTSKMICYFSVCFAMLRHVGGVLGSFPFYFTRTRRVISANLKDALLLNIHLKHILLTGLYVNQPGHSCRDIRDSGDSKGDGEYWIDPEKSENPFKVFCDMTTDGGKLIIMI